MGQPSSTRGQGRQQQQPQHHQAPPHRATGLSAGAAWLQTELAVRSKDFAHIEKFDGTLDKVPDWSDRMSAKFRRAHV
eukprot:7518245-Heterocapsa_arctica.AAC.1